MKRSWKIALAVTGALLVALVVGGAAVASGRMHEAFMQRRVSRHIDAALDAVHATPAQRDAVPAARDHVFTTIAETHQSERADLDAALALWQADSLDSAKLAELRARHQAAGQKIGDAVVQALSDAHDALTAPQRQQLADYLRAHRPPSMEGAKPFMRHMVSEHVDDLLDQIHANADQRTRVHAAVDNVFAAVGDTMSHHGADMEQAIALFTSNQIDTAKVQALQANRQAQMQKVGDAVVQALSDIHDTLDAGQRKQVADFIRSHHHGHGG